MGLPTSLLSCVNKTATPASTLPTVKDTNIVRDRYCANIKALGTVKSDEQWMMMMMCLFQGLRDIRAPKVRSDILKTCLPITSQTYICDPQYAIIRFWLSIPYGVRNKHYNDYCYNRLYILWRLCYMFPLSKKRPTARHGGDAI